MRDTATVEGGQSATLVSEQQPAGGAGQAQGTGPANQRAASALQGRILQSGSAPPWAESDPKLLNGTLAELDAYTAAHPDWVLAEQAKPNGSALWGLVELMRTYTGFSAALGKLTVRDLLARKVLDQNSTLRRYAIAVGNTYTSVELQPVAMDKALKYGAALLKLDGAIPGNVQYDIIKQGSEYGDCLDNLMAQPGLLDAFIKYVEVVKPLLTATNGAEIDGFIHFASDVGNDVTRYASRLRYVHTHHHFEVDALEQLAANEKDTSRARPLTVVLHSAEDHNGAFMRAPSMTQVITDRRNNVIVIEGSATLGAAGAQLGEVVAKYGQGGKADQVMLAGHGEARIMELAASRDDKNQLTEDLVDLDKNGPATEKLLATVVASMSPTSPNRKIMLEACLTNSSTLSDEAIGTMSQDPKLTRDQVGAALDQHESLAAHVQHMATAAKTNAQAIGANGEIYSGGSAKFMDPKTGALTLSDAKDPSMVSDKLDYVRTGTDPAGALRALLQSWSKDPDATKVAVQGRVNAGGAGDDWGNSVILCLYRRALARWTDPQHLITLPGAAGALNEMRWDQAITGDALAAGVPLDERAAIFGELSKTPTWTASPFTQILGLQVWAEVDSTKIAPLLALIKTQYNAQTLWPYLYYNDALSQRVLGAGPAHLHAELVYATARALMSNGTSPPDANSIDFLRKHRTGGRFPAALGMSGVLGGLSSEAALGAAIDGATTTAGGPAPNVALTAHGKPSVYINPDAWDLVARADTSILASPAADAAVVGKLAAGSQLRSFGEYGDRDTGYYAVVVPGRTEPAFVLRSAIDALPTPTP